MEGPPTRPLHQVRRDGLAHACAPYHAGVRFQPGARFHAATIVGMGAAGVDGFTRGWAGKSQLEQVTNWAARGCTMAEIAHNMNTTAKTLYEWCRKHPELDDAIRSGRAMGVQCIENSLFRAAVGDWYEETEVTETGSDGGVRTRRTRVRKAPSVSAQIFYLKNRAGYRDNPPEAPQADAEAPEDPLSAALDEVARGLDGGRHGA